MRRTNAFSPELHWLFPRVKQQLRWHAASFVCLTLASLLALVTPLCIRWLIDSILPALSVKLLLITIGLIFVSYEGRAVLSAGGSYLTFRAAQNTALVLRMSLLRHLDALSADYFDRTPVGESLYPFDAPIDEISYFGSDLLPSILRTIIAAGVTLAAMMVLSPLLTLIITPVIPTFAALRQRYRRRIGERADAVPSARSRFSSFLEEHLSALTQIQLLGETGRQEHKASDLLSDIVGAQIFLARTGVLFSAWSNLAIISGITAILGCGSWMVFSQRLTTGTLIAFYSLLVQLFDPLSMAMETYARAQRTFASIRQLQGVFANVPSVREHPHAQTLSSDGALHIVLRDASFTYPGQTGFVRIPRLEILQGERVAIVGPNGAGKSTLAKLLARLYDVESGEIRLAGFDLRAVTLASLRSRICYLAAQPILFHRSMADNLQVGNSGSTCADMEDVLRVVGLTKYLVGSSTLQGQFIGPGASNLSSGERQRLAIARALLHKPGVLILDEATSSLDPASEEAILRAIDEALPDSTLLVVSHRMHSISWMERILVLENGQIVGDGSHATLCGTNACYTEFRSSAGTLG